MCRRKHRKDYNHGKRGWVAGNPRYCRARAAGRKPHPKDKSMGKN